MAHGAYTIAHKIPTNQVKSYLRKLGKHEFFNAEAKMYSFHLLNSSFDWLTLTQSKIDILSFSESQKVHWCISFHKPSNCSRYEISLKKEKNQDSWLPTRGNDSQFNFPVVQIPTVLLIKTKLFNPIINLTYNNR